MSLEERQPGLEFGRPRPVVREARRDEQRSVCDLLGRAFFDDPVSEYLFPDAKSRADRYARFAGIAIEAFAGSGLVLTEPGIRTGAIWQAPRPEPLGFARQLRVLAKLVGLTRSGLRRAARLGELMSRHHLREPHWYLAVLGTDPDARRAGLASAVLAPVLERCDRERIPAYLESSKAANIPFYNKHGFEVAGELKIPGGPTLWPMVRRTG